MTLYLFGLDTETSAVDPNNGGRLIQIGVTADTDAHGNEMPGTETFTSLVNPGDMRWDTSAEGIHGFSRAEIEAAPAASEVDLALCAWLGAHGATADRSAIAVGFNVASFDLPHLEKVLPKAAKYFSYKAAELNALCYALDGATYRGTVMGEGEWKDMACRYAAFTIHELRNLDLNDTAAHDAGYDALFHLHAYRWLRAAIHGTPWDAPADALPTPQYQIDAATLVRYLGVAGAERVTGIPGDLLTGWAEGGRATDPEGTVFPALRTAVAALS